MCYIHIPTSYELCNHYVEYVTIYKKIHKFPEFLVNKRKGSEYSYPSDKNIRAQLVCTNCSMPLLLKKYMS